MSTPDEPAKRRRLSGEDYELWKTFTRSVKPHKRAVESGPESEHAAPAPPAAAKPGRAPVAAAPVAKPSRAPAPVTLGRRQRQKIASGKDAIERHLDLHGRTQAEAHHALVRFLRAAQADGAKTVLVITGKGLRGGGDSERGVLRRLVPHWLGEAELRNIVIEFSTAHVGHGGEGALYVRLRRPKAPRR